MFEIGNYVKWYEEYADGIAGKDWVDGVLIDKRKYPSCKNDNLFLYKVYRNKHKDFYWFEKRQLKLKEAK